MTSEAPNTYLDLLEDQGGLSERVNRLVEEQIAAKMTVWLSGEAEITIYHKDLLTNKIKYTLFNINNTTAKSEVLRDSISNEELVEEYMIHEDLDIYITSYPGVDFICVSADYMCIQIDKALFLSLLSEYMDMIKTCEIGNLIVTVKREVIKTIRRPI